MPVQQDALGHPHPVEAARGVGDLVGIKRPAQPAMALREGQPARLSDYHDAWHLVLRREMGALRLRQVKLTLLRLLLGGSLHPISLRHS